MKHRRPTRKSLIAVIAMLFIAMLAISSIYGFSNKVRRNETAIADQTLITAANNGVALIQTIFTNYIINLSNIALLYEKADDIVSEESLAMLGEVAKQNGYDRLAVDFPDGRTYTSDGHIFDMASFGYTDKIIRGETFITDVLPAIADGTDVVSFLVPLKNHQGVPIASLRLTMQTTSLTDVLDLTLFGGHGYYHLVDENGKYVAAGQSQNALLMDQDFFDAIAAMDYDEGFSIANITASFTSGKSDFTRYAVDGSERYAYCQPVGINNWVLMTIVPQEIIAKAERQNISLAIRMTVELSAILILIFVYIYWAQRKARMEAILNDKCFRVLAEQTSKVIFEWDFSSNKIVAMNNFKALFGREMTTQNSPKQALEANMVHPDDKVAFTTVFKRLMSGNNVDNIRFRVKHASGEYHWCELSGVVVFDNAKRPYKAIGSLEDINVLVTNEAQMKHRSETDQLTGLYNKTSTEQRIKSLLQAGAKKCALMIIDIDNFKSVNDTLGHQFGDRVLSDFATVLKPFAGIRDVVGRIGGDEFFLFFGDYKDECAVYETAQSICNLFAKTYTEQNKSCNVSASIGISLYPRDGKDFEALYKQADVALYRTKAEGKNGFTAYDESLGDEVSSRTAIDKPAQPPINPT